MWAALVVVQAVALLAPVQTVTASPRALQAEADAAQQSGDLATARRDYERLVAMHPRSAELHTALGGILAQEKQYDRAVGEFASALQGTPRKHQPELLYAIGKAYVADGRFREARLPLMAALAIQPGDLAAAVLLGDCDLELKEPQAAVDLMAPRATLSTRDIPFLRVYGRALVETGKLNEGAQMLEHVAQATGDAGTYELAGETFLKNEDIPSARRNLELARKVDPTLKGNDLLLAKAREQAGDTYASEAVFRDELKPNADDFSANLYLGTLLYKHHKAAEAEAYLNHAVALQPGDPGAQCASAALRTNTTCKLTAIF